MFASFTGVQIVHSLCSGDYWTLTSNPNQRGVF